MKIIPIVFGDTFVEQEYIISVLKVNLISSRLFGNSRDLAIKGCCTLFFLFYDEFGLMTQMILLSTNRESTVENNVNIASVMFSGDISGNTLLIGGVSEKDASSTSS